MNRLLLDDALDALLRSDRPFLQLQDSDSGEVKAYIVRAEFMPTELRAVERKPLPRRLRPKAKLSKRQRDAAKAERLRPSVAA